MRKFILGLGTLVLIASFFSACGAVNSVFKDEPDISSVSGIISEQDSGDTYEGTHLLITDDNSVVALRSLSLNLSAKNYLGNRVTLVGVKNDEDAVFEVTGISLDEVLLPSEPDAILVEYINTDLGFKLKHYDNWILQDKGDEIVFFAPAELGEESDQIIILQSPFDYSPTISDEGEVDTALRSYAEKNLSLTGDFESYIQLIGPDKLNAIARESKLGDEFYYYLYRNKLIYTISFIASDNFNPDHINVFNELISSFRFIGLTETSDPEIVNQPLPETTYKLTKFRSKPYSFSASYPANWYYSGASSAGDSFWIYSFSDEADGAPLIFLEVLSGDKTSGTPTIFEGNELYISELNAEYIVHVKLDKYTFKVYGDPKYSDLIKVMAVSIAHSEE